MNEMVMLDNKGSGAVTSETSNGEVSNVSDKNNEEDLPF